MDTSHLNSLSLRLKTASVMNTVTGKPPSSLAKLQGGTRPITGNLGFLGAPSKPPKTQEELLNMCLDYITISNKVLNKVQRQQLRHFCTDLEDRRGLALFLKSPEKTRPIVIWLTTLFDADRKEEDGAVFTAAFMLRLQKDLLSLLQFRRDEEGTRSKIVVTPDANWDEPMDFV